MSTSNLIRWSGLAAILGGLFLALGSISLESPWSWLGILGFLLLVFGLIGIYGVQVESSGMTGFIGFVLAVTGSVLLAGGDNNIFNIPFWILGSMLTALGLILLAVGTLSAGKFPRWVPWLWIASVLVGVPAIFAGSLLQILGILAAFAAGLGMAGAGYVLWSRTSQ